MDIVGTTGKFRDASLPTSIAIGGTFADPQTSVSLRNGSATVDGSAATAAEASKSPHCVCPWHASFDEHSLATKSLGRLGKSGREPVD